MPEHSAHTPCCTVCRGTTARQSVPPAPMCTDKCMADKGDEESAVEKERLLQVSTFFLLFLQISGKKQYFERIMTQMNTSTSMTVPFSAEPAAVAGKQTADGVMLCIQ